jgi:hypothetical protein
MGNSAMTREAIRNHAGGWLVLWLTAEPHRAPGSNGRNVPSPAGPMRGSVELPEDPEADWFLLRRYGRRVVRIAYAQVSTWAEVAPPPEPPMAVEDLPR